MFKSIRPAIIRVSVDIVFLLVAALAGLSAATIIGWFITSQVIWAFWLYSNKEALQEE